MTETGVPLFSLHHFSTAERFLEFLRLSNPLWGEKDAAPKSNFLFRGHWDADWELRPPAWRVDGQKLLEPIRARIDQTVRKICTEGDEKCISWATQNVQEFVALKTFHSVADEQGLEIPLFPAGHNNSENWFWDQPFVASTTALF